MKGQERTRGEEERKEERVGGLERRRRGRTRGEEGEEEREREGRGEDGVSQISPNPLADLHQ